MKVQILLVIAGLSLVDAGARYKFNGDLCHLNTEITKDNLRKQYGGSVSSLEIEMTTFCRVPSIFCHRDRFVLGKGVNDCCMAAKKFCVDQSANLLSACGSYCECWKEQCVGHF